MRTLAFASIKGGVGKTTLAVHVAAALAEMGRSTLLMDLDPQGHATAMAGIELPPDAHSIADVFGAQSRVKIADVLRPSPRQNLVVAPANGRMIALERDLFRWGHRLQAIRRALEPVAARFDALVIDTPPQLNAFTETALWTGDVVVVPLPSLAHAVQGLEEIRVAHRDITDGSKAPIVGAVNLWDRRTSATNAAMEQAFSELTVPVAKSRIIRAEVLNQAALAYQLVFDIASTSEVAESLRSLARELWQRAGRGESARDS